MDNSLENKINLLTKIPLTLSIPENINEIQKNLLFKKINEQKYFHIINFSSEKNCNMLRPVHLIIGHLLTDTSNDTYYISLNCLESLDSEFKKIYENEIKKYFSIKKENFFSFLKKRDPNELKKEADALFLSKKYKEALIKYQEYVNEDECSLHFKELSIYCQLLLNENINTSFLFYKNILNTERHFRILSVLIFSLKINTKYIFQISQSLHLMDLNIKKCELVIELSFLKEKSFVFLFFESAIFYFEKNEFEKANLFFDLVKEIVKKDEVFFCGRFINILSQI